MIKTRRLLLRQFREADRDPWAALNADPEVTAHFPKALSRAESDALMDRVSAKIADTGTGFWAVERMADGVFLGFAGLNCVTNDDVPVFGEWEVGWRLARHAWKQGYASEAGLAALAHGFDTLGLKRIVAYTAITNMPSAAVMQRIGMHPAPERSFDHPIFPANHPSRRHIVYVIRR